MLKPTALSSEDGRDNEVARQILNRGSEVVDIEANALASLAGCLNQSFVDAVLLLTAIKGRAVVTGMGKSGHVGRKIAATLSSTGTPAFFVHPAEASHGDLGMLMANDLLLALSNSGSTPELRSIVLHAKSMNVPVIVVASRADSPMMRQADVKLLLPPARETCPVNISPTTSAILMLSLGDALAMAAMDVRGFSGDRLRSLHPGGTIGFRFTRVSAIMHCGDSVPLVHGSVPMRDVIVTMTAMSFGVAGVIDDDGDLVGVITDGDLRRHVDDLLTSTATDVMTPNPVMIRADSVAEDALALMNRNRITSLFVTDAITPRRPIGLLHVHDFLRQGLG